MIGLDNLDNKILKLLGEKPAYSSEVSLRLNVLRTTIQYRLKRLCEAGLIRKDKDGQKSVWQIIYKNSHNKNYYRIYESKEFIQAYRQFLLLPQETIIFCVQGNDAARSQLRIFPSGFIKEAHRVYKRKRIILKGIINEKTLETVDILDEDMLKSHLGRTQAIKAFSGDKFLGFGEIFSTEGVLMLSNLRLKTALVIKDKEITKMANDIFKVFFNFLNSYKTFDLKQYIMIQVQL